MPSYFSMLSPAEIAMLVAQDPNFRLPVGDPGNASRMAESRRWQADPHYGRHVSMTPPRSQSVFAQAFAASAPARHGRPRKGHRVRLIKVKGYKCLRKVA